MNTMLVFTMLICVAGKVYAVNLEKCQENVSAAQWARGVVTELPGHKRVRVRLPDCGSSLLLHWSSLRYLQTKFTTLSALVSLGCSIRLVQINKKYTKLIGQTHEDNQKPYKRYFSIINKL